VRKHCAKSDKQQASGTTEVSIVHLTQGATMLSHATIHILYRNGVVQLGSQSNYSDYASLGTVPLDGEVRLGIVRRLVGCMDGHPRKGARASFGAVASKVCRCERQRAD
jgi:hypothetical protein